MNFECPACNQIILNVPDDLSGKRGKCPHCQKVIKIPLEGISAKSPSVPPRPPIPKHVSDAVSDDIDFETEQFDPEEVAPRRKVKSIKKQGRPERERYQMLKLYQSCIRIAAFVIIAASVVLFLFSVISTIVAGQYVKTEVGTLLVVLLTGGGQMLAAVLSAIVILAGVEFMQLFIDMERQLRKNGELLESIKKSE